MLLVMIGHAPFPELPLKLIYSFHVPFFFGLSGWLHNPQRHATFGSLLRSRGRTLVLPYFLYSLVGYLGLAAQWAMGHRPWGLSWSDPILGTVLGVRNSTPYNGTLWFVACLFVTECLYHWLNRIAGRRAGIAFLLSLLPMVQMLKFPVGLPFHYPWSLDAALVAVSFFAFGQLLRSVWHHERFVRSFGGLALLCAVYWLGGALLAGRIDMYSVRWETPLLSVSVAMSGILGVFWLLPRIGSFGWIGFLGRHSLVFLALHEWFAYFFARSLQGRLPWTEGLAHSWGLALVGFCYVGFAMLLLWPVCLAFDRWLPVMVGGRK